MAQRPTDDATGLDLQVVVSAVLVALEQRGLRRALAVGHVLVHLLYDGDTTAFRGRADKPVSLRRLAAEVPVSAAALCRCLSVHEIWVRTQGSRWPRLGASHYRAVESLRPETQKDWLATADARKWSAALLREAVLASGVRVAVRGGRLPEHSIARLTARVERELGLVDAIADEITVHPQQRDEMALVADRLDVAAEHCRKYAARLRSPTGFPEVRSQALPPTCAADAGVEGQTEPAPAHHDANVVD